MKSLQSTLHEFPQSIRVKLVRDPIPGLGKVKTKKNKIPQNYHILYVYTNSKINRKFVGLCKFILQDRRHIKVV